VPNLRLDMQFSLRSRLLHFQLQFRKTLRHISAIIVSAYKESERHLPQDAASIPHIGRVLYVATGIGGTPLTPSLLLWPSCRRIRRPAGLFQHRRNEVVVGN